MSVQSDSLSITRDPVFDWGSTRRMNEAGGRGAAAAPGRGASTRYDPDSMNRIADVDDLVDDSSDEESDGDKKGRGDSGLDRRAQSSNYGPGGVGSRICLRQAVIVASLVGLIVAACAAVGYAVVIAAGERSGVDADGGTSGQQQLLETAERVVAACSEAELDEDLSECQRLCRSRMCCFGGGEYSCEEDGGKDCAVYAGCAALVEGIPLDSAETDED